MSVVCKQVAQPGSGIVKETKGKKVPWLSDV